MQARVTLFWEVFKKGAALRIDKLMERKPPNIHY